MEQGEVLIRGEFDKKAAVWYSIYLGMYVFLGGAFIGMICFAFAEMIVVPTELSYEKVMACSFITGCIAGGIFVILNYIERRRASSFIIERRRVSSFIVIDVCFFTSRIEIPLEKVLSVEKIAFSGIMVNLQAITINGIVLNQYYIYCLKNRDEISAILMHKPTPESAPMPLPEVEPEPMYEDCKVAVEEPERPIAMSVNADQRKGIQLFAAALLEIAQKRRREEAERKRIAKIRRKEKEDNLNALKILFDNGHLTQEEYEEKKKRILRVTTTTYPLK